MFKVLFNLYQVEPFCIDPSSCSFYSLTSHGIYIVLMFSFMTSLLPSLGPVNSSVGHAITNRDQFTESSCGT